MHDHGRQVGNLVHVAQQLVRFQERVVHKVVAFNTGNGQCPVRVAEALDHLRVGPQGGGAAFPGRPCLGHMHLGNLVVAREALVKGTHQVVTLFLRDRRDIVLPVVGENPAGPCLIEPFDFLRPRQKDPTQNQAMYLRWMALRVRQ